MRNRSQRRSPSKAETPPKLSFREFCRYSWIALKQVKPVGMPIYVAAIIYASLGGWPFPDGRYISILGAFLLVIWLAIVEVKLKIAFNEARTSAEDSELS